MKTYSKTVAGGTSTALTVSVDAPQTEPVVTTSALPSGTAGSGYSATLTASGGIDPYCSASGLPAGLTINPTGGLAGTPASPGVSPIIVVATDSTGRSASATLNLRVVAASGHAWAWGYNGNGELGNNTIASSPVLVPVTGLTSVAAITAGESAGYAVGSDGSAWAWGDNTSGQLGINSTVSTLVPVRVGGLTGITAMGAAAAPWMRCAATARCGRGAMTATASSETTRRARATCRFRSPA